MTMTVVVCVNYIQNPGWSAGGKIVHLRCGTDNVEIDGRH